MHAFAGWHVEVARLCHIGGAITLVTNINYLRQDKTLEDFQKQTIQQCVSL